METEVYEAPDFVIDIEIGNHRLKENVVDMLRFNTEDMLSELVEHSATYAYVVMLEVEAEKELTSAKKDRDVLFGELLLSLRDEKEASGRNFTVDMQKATVNRTPSMIEANDIVAIIEEKVKRLKKLSEAFEHRKMMLSSAANWIGRSETAPYVKPNPKEAVATARAKKV